MYLPFINHNEIGQNNVVNLFLIERVEVCSDWSEISSLQSRNSIFPMSSHATKYWYNVSVVW